MASCTSSQWVSNSPTAKLIVTQASSTGDTVTLNWELQYVSTYAASTAGNDRAYNVYIDGVLVKEGGYNINGVTGTKTVASGSRTVNKTTSSRSVTFSLEFRMGLTWSGSYKEWVSASGSIDIGAKTSYTVSYNANGGSGAPGNQTKWYGTNLTLSATTPSRTGYSFQGWGTSAGATSAAYAAGGTYSSNSNITLYAVWKANTYTVSYNANGGSGAPGNQTKTYGVNLTLSSTKPTRTNYNFVGWGTSAGATSAAYAAGGTYSSNSNITLYAVWSLAYTKPRITSISASRCNSGGSVSDSGTYAKISFSWATDISVSSIVIGWKTSSASSYSTINVGASGTSGNVSTVIGNGNISVEYSYNISINVTDSSGSTTKYTTVAGQHFTMDLLSGGKGIAFGKPAELSEYMDCDYTAMFRKRTYSDGSDLGFNQTHATSGYKVGFGVGSGGINRGVYDTTNTKWMIYANENETIINPCNSNIRLAGTTYLGASGSTAVTSDRNLKKDVGDLSDKYIGFFSKLRPVTYKYKTTDFVGHRDHVGFIAQEVEDALIDSGLTTEQFAGVCIEDLVGTTEETDTLKKRYSLRYEEFIALNTHIIQRQQQKINELEARLSKLEKLLEVINDETV